MNNQKYYSTSRGIALGCSKAIHRLFLALLVFFFSTTVHAQGGFMVKGNVVDEDKQPIVGATVQDKVNKKGAVTDLNGDFTIQASTKQAVLSVQYVGMNPVQVNVNGRQKITVVMKETSVNVDEVVVTALGIKRDAKALGYAVSSVDNDVLTAGNEQNVMSALSGKVAGVDISSTSAGPSGSTRVIIRGNAQLSGSNQPLYVIDGMPIDNTEQAEGAGKWGGYDLGDVMGSLNPDDIENISVLKGPSASALYGSRASNGVVLITTKSASKKKGIGIEFSTNLSITNLLSGFDDYQREYGQGQDYKPAMSPEIASTTTQVSWGAKLDPNINAYIYNGELRPYGNVNNNILSFFKTGVTTTNTASFNKSTKEGSFRVSVSDMRNWDIVPKSDLSRTSVTLKGNSTLSKLFEINGQATYTYEKVSNRPALSDSPSNIGNALIGIAPSFNQKWLGENYKDANGRYHDWNGNIYRINPYWVINEMKNTSSRNRLIGQVKFTYNILSYLKATFRTGVDTYNFRFTEYMPQYTPSYTEGQMRERSNYVNQFNYEGMLRFEKRFGDFDISSFIGANYMTYKYESFLQTGKSQVIPNLMDITNYNTIETQHTLTRKAVKSAFGQASFGYKSIYYLDFTVRNDVSSTLSPDNRSYWYPSLSGSLVFSNLFKHGKWLSFGKVRASWAKVGGDTTPYQLQLEYGLKPYTVNGVSLGQISSTSVPNYNLKPTKTHSIEFGLDVRFFDSRVSLDVTYYNQNTKDQILYLPVSKATGYNKAGINAGEIDNKGIEASLTLVPIRSKSFRWDFTTNFAKNDNKVVKLHEDVKDFELAAARWANAFIYASEGQPYGVIVGKKILRTSDGEMILKNGLPQTESEVSVLGNGNYDFTMGIRNAFRYKDLSISFLIDMKFGADLYSMSMMQAHFNGTSKETLEGRKEWAASEQARLAAGIDADKWTATGGYLAKGVKEVKDANGNVTYEKNDVYVDPRRYWQSLQDSSPEPFVVDNSFAKLREVSLSYSLPKAWLARTPIESLTLSAYGRNLWIIHSNVKNIDPESSYNNGNGQGLELGSLPSRRTFGFGAKIKF